MKKAIWSIVLVCILLSVSGWLGYYYGSRSRSGINDSIEYRIDTLEVLIGVEGTRIDSFWGIREVLKVERIRERDSLRSLPLDSGVLLLRSNIKGYEEDSL